MKTFPYQAVQTSHGSVQALGDLALIFQKSAACLSGPTINTYLKVQSLHPSVDYLHLVQQAEQYMMQLDTHVVSIDMLCTALHISRRTLHTAFREVVGIGPMSCLKIQRMKQVHQQLEQAHPLAATVTDIACEWGFYHMGHFSKDYKDMFGEFPSDTLKRKPSRSKN